MTSDSPSPDFREMTPAALALYLSGEADRDECAQVDRWIAADPEHRAEAERLHRVWTRPTPPEFDADGAVWARIRERIGGEQGTAPALRIKRGDAMPQRQVRLRFSPKLTSGGPSRWWGAAAALALACGAALIAQIDRAKSDRPAVEETVGRKIATRRGERMTLRLADGTHVVLGAESQLWIETGFAADARGPRTVRLVGEAFFEVVHSATRPFRVYTPTSIVEDLGTEFVVTSYPETNGTRVVVASGVVAMYRGGITLTTDTSPLVTLGRGDLGEVDTAGIRVVQRDIDVTPYLRWTRDTLVFDGTALAEAVPALGRWYDIDLRLADSALARKKLTAEFSVESAAEALDLISMSLGLTVEPRGGFIMLRARSDRRSN